MPEHDLFDNALFHISRAEVLLMDPAHRTILEDGYDALHQRTCGQDDGQDIGLFVGIDNLEFCQILPSLQHDDNVYTVSSTGLSVAAGRISFTLGFQGPCIALDCACASALEKTPSDWQPKTTCSLGAMVGGGRSAHTLCQPQRPGS